jgi:predicted MPP superfamily phosphohydrolase
MNNLIIGDVHTKFEKVEKIISQYDKDCSIIFVGDYFDEFHDSPEQNADTARWLKESLTKKNRVHLFGNHDFQYRIKPIGMVAYSGFHYKKYEKINEVMAEDDWEKLKYFHSIDRYWFSHAGITEYWFQHPVLGLTVEGINEIISKAKEAVKVSDLEGAQPLIAAD